jgi:hypothetical protein
MRDLPICGSAQSSWSMPTFAITAEVLRKALGNLDEAR